MKLGCLILAGERSNVVKGAGLSSSSASAMATLASLEALRDGRNNQAFRFASPASPQWIRADVRGLVNGGFETWSGGVAEGWTLYTTGSGVAAQESTVVREGASALRLSKSATSDNALAFQRAIVPSGARRRLRWSLRGNTGGNIGLLVSNTRTGRSLAPDGTWTKAVNVALVGGSSAWVDGHLDFTVEPAAVTGADLCELVTRVYAGGNSTGNLYADAIELLPLCDFVALSGHNIDPGTAVELFGLDGAAGFETETLVAAIEPWQPACYRRFAAAAYPAWLLRFTSPNTGLNSDGAVWLAEWILGAPYEGRIIRQGMKAHEQERQIEQTTPSGHRTVRNRTVRAARSLDVAWQLLGAAQLAEFKEEIFARGRGGQRSVCVVPWLDLERNASTPPVGERTVLVASVDQDVQWTWATRREFQLALTLDEQAFPAVDELLE